MLVKLLVLGLDLLLVLLWVWVWALVLSVARHRCFNRRHPPLPCLPRPRPRLCRSP
jgi:hypothetical protein